MAEDINSAGSNGAIGKRSSKSKRKTTGTGTRTRTGTGTGTPPETGTETVNPSRTEETKVNLEEVISSVAAENVEPRLKSAGLDPLPDETILTAGAASMLLMLLDGVGMLAFGDTARMNPMEKRMIEEPLERILKRVSPGALTAVNKYTDPVLLLMGLLAWISRINSESKKPEPKPNPKPEPEPMGKPEKQPDQPANTNIPLDLLDTLRMAEL